MFIVLLTGDGEGCGYYIGCNMVFKTLKAETWEDAKAEVHKLCDYSERIAKARILEVIKAEDFDVAAWMEEQRKKEQEKNTAKRKDLYERLKKEFGN